jgi:hypothetical protein
MKKGYRTVKRKQKTSKMSPRAETERMVGRLLLRGKIPVAPTCPIPPEHVKNFDDCCRDYADGKMSDADVLSRVSEMLKGIRKPEPKGETQT